MILYNIELEEDFHNFLIENIKEAKEFALQNSDLVCFITVSKANKNDAGYYDARHSFSASLNYKPKPDPKNPNDDLIRIEDYIAEKLHDDSYLNYLSMNLHSISDGYGSHTLQISETEFDNLERLYKSLIRNNNIDSIFEN